MGSAFPKSYPQKTTNLTLSQFLWNGVLPSRKLDEEGGRKGGREIAQATVPQPHPLSQQPICLMDYRSADTGICLALGLLGLLSYLPLFNLWVTLWGKCAWLPSEINSIEVPQGNSFKVCSGMGPAQVSSFGFLQTLYGLLVYSWIPLFFTPLPIFWACS